MQDEKSANEKMNVTEVDHNHHKTNEQEFNMNEEHN